MSDFSPSSIVPADLNRSRWVRNGRLPEARFVRFLADGFNHILAYRKKHLFSWVDHFDQQERGVSAGSSSSDVSRWYCRFRTGYGTDKIVIKMVLAPSDSASSSDPRCRWEFSGGSSVNSGYFRYALEATSGEDYPDRLHTSTLTVSVSSNSTYTGVLKTWDYCRPVACCIYELGDIPVPDTEGGINPGFAVGDPVYDESAIKQMLETGTDLWKRNASVHLWWTRNVTSPTFGNGATANNILDQTSTSVSSSTPGWTIDLSNRGTINQSTVPVEFAVRAERTGGSGNCYVYLKDSSSTLLTVGPITSDGWYTTTGSLTAGSQKVDVHAYGGALTGLRVDAVCLAEYQA